MIKLIKGLAIEVTRRCNLHCEHCMRGDAQNIDIPLSYIDKILDEPELIIHRLVFSGGEPTLVSDIIIYTIEKIIRERKIILSIHITTNGLIYDERLIEALTKYIAYTQKVLPSLQKHMEIADIVNIRLSTDQYHQKIPHQKYYQIPNPHIHVSETGNLDVLDDQVLKTGRYKDGLFGRYFEYKLHPLKITPYPSMTIFENDYYLTATGFVTSNGDGEYQDMDKINLGRVEDFTFASLVEQPNKLQKK